MSFEAPALMLPGMLANADLSAKQFFCIKVTTTAGKVDLNTTSGGPVIGILQNKPKSGEEAMVATAGVSKCVAGAAVSMGDLLMSDGAGKVITFVPSTSNKCIGQALEATVNGANDVIAVALVRGFGTTA
jgi:hypothetical protein